MLVLFSVCVEGSGVDIDLPSIQWFTQSEDSWLIRQLGLYVSHQGRNICCDVTYQVSHKELIKGLSGSLEHGNFKD